MNFSTPLAGILFLLRMRTSPTMVNSFAQRKDE